jgi:hypothetical protein
MDAGDRETFVGEEGPRVSGRMRLVDVATRIAEALERRSGPSRPPPPKPEDEGDAEPLSVEPDPPSAMH